MRNDRFGQTGYIRQIYGTDAPEHGWTGGDCQPSKQVLGILDRRAVCVVNEVLELMSIPINEADLRERNLKLRVFECMMKAGLQFHPRRTRQCTQRTPRATGAALRADKQDVSWIRRAHLFRCCDTLGAGDPVFFARRSRKNAKLGAVSEARRNLLAARSTA